MLFYRFNRDPDDQEFRWVYAATLDAVRSVARENKPHSFQPVVEEVEIPTDKRSVTTLLNGADPAAEVRRAWGVTPRGALRLMGEQEFADYFNAYYAP